MRIYTHHNPRNSRSATRKITQTKIVSQVGSYVPRLSSWGNEYHDEILTVGSKFYRLRKGLSWLTAELRKSKIKVDRDGNPLEKNIPAPETYRWEMLFLPDETAGAAWDHRFAEGSWFRQVLSLTSSQLPKLLGIDHESEKA